MSISVKQEKCGRLDVTFVNAATGEEEEEKQETTHNVTQPRALVRGSSLSHRLGVLELIHVTPQLLQVLLQLSVFP